MTRHGTLTLATIALFALAGTARAQRASLAVGAVAPIGDFSSSAGAGLDLDLQARTEPMIGPLSLRIDIGYEFFRGKDVNVSTTVSAQSLGVVGDIGSKFYWVTGPGYFESTVKTQISGHPINEQRTYFGAQAAVGMNLPVFRWEGFLEVSGVKLFSSGPGIVYVPVRFGIRL
jgi:hypothetical protein